MQIERCRYRGYQIQTRREWSNWCVTVHPMRPELPILAQSALRTLSPRKEDALSEAKDNIDQALASMKTRVA
jgi:hypothetical protein